MTPFRQRVLVTTLILFGVLAVSFFGMRTLHAFREFRGHRPPGPPFGDTKAETDVELIRDWMTIGFVSRMYHMPHRLLYDALQITPHGNEDKSLKQLNDEYYPDQPDHVITIVKATIQANLPPTPAVPPATAVSPVTAVPPASP